MKRPLICAVVLVAVLSLPSLLVCGEVYAFLFVGDGDPGLLDAIWGSERDIFEASKNEMRSALEREWQVDGSRIVEVNAWEIRRLDFHEQLEAFTTDDHLGPDDVVLFYYVGHGDGYGLQPDFMSGDMYLPYSELDDLLNHVAGNTVIILDSCSSGSGAGELVSGEDRRLIAAASEGKGSRVRGWVGTALDLIGAPATPFTAALVDAMRSGETSIQGMFKTAMNSLTAFFRESRAGTPCYFYHAGAPEDLELVFSTIEFLGISVSLNDTTRVSSSGVATGSAYCDATVKLDSTCTQCRVRCDYTVRANPSQGRGSARISMTMADSFPLIGKVTISITIEAEGTVRYGVFPNAESEYAPATMQGYIEYAGMRVAFEGSGEMQGKTSGTSAQDVNVNLEFNLKVDL